MKFKIESLESDFIFIINDDSKFILLSFFKGLILKNPAFSIDDCPPNTILLNGECIPINRI